MSAAQLRLPLAVFAFITAATIALSWLPNVWHDWSPDYCRNVNCYCEPLRNRFVLQAINAYSNLGFVLVSLLILGQAIPQQPLPREAYQTHFRIYGLAALLIGAGSFFYHASLTRVGEWFDLMGLYLFTSFLLLYNLARLRPLNGVTFAAIYIGLSSLFGIQMIVARELQQIVFGLLAAGALGLEVVIHWRRRRRIRHRYFAAAIGCFIVGAVIWILDGRGALPCWPESLFQWHALWHVLTAASAGLLYLYYRSERE